MRKLLLTVSLGKHLQLPETCTNEIGAKKGNKIRTRNPWLVVSIKS